MAGRLEDAPLLGGGELAVQGEQQPARGGLRSRGELAEQPADVRHARQKDEHRTAVGALSASASAAPSAPTAPSGLGGVSVGVELAEQHRNQLGGHAAGHDALQRGLGALAVLAPTRRLRIPNRLRLRRGRRRRPSSSASSSSSSLGLVLERCPLLLRRFPPQKHLASSDVTARLDGILQVKVVDGKRATRNRETPHRRRRRLAAALCLPRRSGGGGEVLHETVGVDGGRHEDDFEVWISRESIAKDDEQKVRVERAFVHLRVRAGRRRKRPGEVRMEEKGRRGKRRRSRLVSLSRARARAASPLP